MRIAVFVTLSVLFVPFSLAMAQVPDIVRKITNQASNYDPSQDPAQNPPKPAQPSANPATPVDPLAARLASWIVWPAPDGTKVRLYYAHPDYRAAKGAPKLPALLVVQEWWGVNEDIQQRTRDLAAKGYYAVAVDLYDGHVTKDPKEAAALKNKLTDEAALLRTKTGMDFLQAQAAAGIVDAGKTGVIGWCMGGEQALKLSVADARVKATAIFYGPLITDATKLSNLKGPVLGVFGNNDQHPSPADVNAFEASLKTDNIPVTIYRYDGVGHAFASPSAKVLGLYHEKEAADAFEKTYIWLAANLQKTAS